MKKHIFLVDDDEDEMLFLNDALMAAHISFKCTWAKNGEQALEQLAFLVPDIIFLDLSMPGMDGLECLARIKSMDRLRGIPVVLHSSALRKEIRARAIGLGAAACLEKSASGREIAMVLERLLGEPADPEWTLTWSC
jgi:CheY-like chemotaxis protein